MIFAFQKEVSWRKSVDKRLKIVHIAFKILSCQCCYVIVNLSPPFHVKLWDNFVALRLAGTVMMQRDGNVFNGEKRFFFFGLC